MSNRMARTGLALLLCLLTSIVSGCGSGPSGAGRVATGRAVLRIRWPQQTRLIPNAANSIVVVVNQGATALMTQVLPRPATGGTASVTFDPLPVGTLSVTATAFPNSDGTGVAQAAATAPLVIQASQTTSFTLTMNSTIDHLVISPSPTNVQVGLTIPLTVTAVDATGAIVLITPSKLAWSPANATASVDASGKLTGIAVGATSMTVTETESGKAATVQITVMPPQEATAYRMNPTHTGAASFGVPLTFPSSPAWSIDLGAFVSYPLIVSGRVYVVVNGQLMALDAKTGKTLWTQPGVGFGPTYDGGKIFTVTQPGVLKSYDAVTGAPGWSKQLPGQYFFDANPTAYNGIVYEGGAGSGGTVYATDEKTGALLWTASVANGDESSPTVTQSGVYVSYPCQTYAFNPTTGAVIWHYNGGCDGGGGQTDALANGMLYDGYNGIIFNASTGAQTGAFLSVISGGRSPALGTRTGYFGESGTLRARDLATFQALWSFAGDGQVNTDPLLIDQTVFVGSGSGNVYALDVTTGHTIWTGNAGAAIPTSNGLTGFAAGEGYLIVPAGNRLTAWRIVGP